MKEPFSTREWAGPALGVALGFIFGYVLAAHGTTAVFLFFILGVVPGVMWLSPERPVFGWQLAIITFALCFAPTIRDYPQQPFDLKSYLLNAVLVWTGSFRHPGECFSSAGPNSLLWQAAVASPT